jgi:ribosomal protein L11 methyltransferase
VDFLLRARTDLSLLEEHHFSYEEWQGTRVDPLRIGRFLIVPPWKREAAGEGEVRIILDPGVVFGTGIHPTTGDCLGAMAYMSGKTALETVLDLGTGTGILAVAAARLGAKRVLAVDLNPLCIKTAKRNVQLNEAAPIVEVLEGRAEDYAAAEADLVVANIHYEVLKNLVEREPFRERAWMILSGLMRSQGRDIKARLQDSGFSLVKEWDGEGTWTTLLASATPKSVTSDR